MVQSFLYKTELMGRTQCVLLHNHLLLCRSLRGSQFFSHVSEGRCSLLTGGQQAFDRGLRR